MLTRWDTCIIGQGIAGTSLAWALRWAGQRVAVIDRPTADSASRVAAGLITPITGQRLVKHSKFDECWRTAVGFYRRVEAESGGRYFHEVPMVRLFAGPGERRKFEERTVGNFAECVRTVDPRIDESCFDAPHGGFEMAGGRLNVGDYLTASRDFFTRDQCFFEGHVDPATDVNLRNGSVQIPPVDLQANRVVFCEGFAGSRNPWFQTVPFDAAKGEVMSVVIPGLNETRVIHRGIWISQTASNHYRVGATFDRENLNDKPTRAGRDELCERLKEFLKIPFEVVDHAAAVRPIIVGKTPRLGFHPKFPELGYFNGLASKGALQAPWFAQHFAAVLAGERQMQPQFDVRQHMDLHECAD